MGLSGLVKFPGSTESENRSPQMGPFQRARNLFLAPQFPRAAPKIIKRLLKNARFSANWNVVDKMRFSATWNPLRARYRGKQ